MIEVQPKTLVYYDFMEMFHAIEKKYGIDLHDVKGAHKGGYQSGVPYCNFWHWLLNFWDGQFVGQFEKGRPINDVDWEEALKLAKNEQSLQKNTKAQDDWVIQCITYFRDEFGHLGPHTVIVDW